MTCTPRARSPELRRCICNFLALGDVRALRHEQQMRWDDLFWTGSHDRWSWFVSRHQIPNVDKLVVRYHHRCRLAIASFDSGPILPDSEERSLGWSVVDNHMISPPLVDDLQLPCDQNDEWYVFNELPQSVVVSERYVRYFCFNLADPKLLAASQDPTWDRTNYDWLAPLQIQFWNDILRLSPITYIASGDVEVVVTSDPKFSTMISSLLSNRKP